MVNVVSCAQVPPLGLYSIVTVTPTRVGVIDPLRVVVESTVRCFGSAEKVMVLLSFSMVIVPPTYVLSAVSVSPGTAVATAFIVYVPALRALASISALSGDIEF